VAAVAAMPPGEWAVAVSGGADSVALLELLCDRRDDLALHVVHLDHETRGGQSAADAAFVAELARSHDLPVTLSTRSAIEATVGGLPRNTSARFRQLRLRLFREVVRAHGLSGVIVAHHADDQAETILQRLLRGSGPAGLSGMSADSTLFGVRVLRPLLGVRRAALRAVLRERGVGWREDASNTSPAQQRNRVRAVLARHPALTAAALELGRACAELSHWLRAAAPVLGERFSVAELRGLPPPVAREAAARWLAARAADRHPDHAVEIPPAAAKRLVRMVEDAASPPRQHFPGGILVRRRGGLMSV
jgi:tRNA(Ile)-lysidine synthetase-like protein